MSSIPPNPPPGQGPIDPQGAFSPPPPPPGGSAGQPAVPPAVPPPHPPMMMMGIGPQSPPRSFTRMVFMTLASTIFGLSLLVNLYVLGYLVLSSEGAAAQKTVVVKGDAK